ncbi:aminotransferase class V-fold PLP-dependent enzyme [Fodinicurvata fenggangensis]|uniref:aminotransferase class V-fold PLP-dependent enzyme n=1 Tax=Fodinicurvata fenggangensis TaxID=1121830 RepID=UPI000AC417AB
MTSMTEPKPRTAGHNQPPALDVDRIRKDFPILERQVYGRPLVYLDNAASAQKPRQVIQAMTDVMEGCYSNVHRGVHKLSQESTDLYEGARGRIAQYINAASSDEIVFTRGATEAINLVASGLGQGMLQPGDEVVISWLEHHSNIVPWQLLRDRLGIELKVVPIDEQGNFLYEDFLALLGPKTKLVAVTHISNALGTITPIADIIAAAHEKDIPVLVDGCQAVPHMKVDVQALGADFYTFSGHKLYGPTGIGVLYGRKDLLNRLPPYQGGGEMISSVTFERSTFKSAPHRFEAGTPAIVEAIGLGAAVDYMNALDFQAITAHEQDLLSYAETRLSEIEGLTILGQAEHKAAIVSFTMDGAHPHDIGTIVDRAGVAIRAGHHCAQPIMDRYGVAATVRASFGLYNTRAEVDKLTDALHQVKELFG